MSLADEPTPWAKYNVPNYTDTNTTTTSMPDDVLPKRARVEVEPSSEQVSSPDYMSVPVDTFDPSTVPPATVLDYAEVPEDADVGGFNALFYLFKCKDPDNPGKALFIKHSEVPLLLKKAHSGNYYVLYGIDPVASRIRTEAEKKYSTYGIYVAYEKKTNTYSLQFTKKHSREPMDTSGEMNLFLKRAGTQRLWQNYGVRDIKGYNHDDEIYRILFFMGVKYPDRCSKTLLDTIAETYENRARNQTENYFLRQFSRIDDKLKEVDEEREALRVKMQELDNKAKVLAEKKTRNIFWRHVTPIEAAVAYRQNAHPEDEEVQTFSQKEAKQRLGMQ